LRVYVSGFNRGCVCMGQYQGSTFGAEAYRAERSLNLLWGRGLRLTAAERHVYIYIYIYIERERERKRERKRERRRERKRERERERGQETV